MSTQDANFNETFPFITVFGKVIRETGSASIHENYRVESKLSYAGLEGNQMGQSVFQAITTSRRR